MRLLAFFDATTPDLLLEAAKDRYMQMLPEETIEKFFVVVEAFPILAKELRREDNDPRALKAFWDREVTFAVNELKRADRITWYLRYIKVYILRWGLMLFARHINTAFDGWDARWLGDGSQEAKIVLDQLAQQLERTEKKVNSELRKLQQNTTKYTQEITAQYEKGVGDAMVAQKHAQDAVNRESTTSTRSRLTNAETATQKAMALFQALSSMGADESGNMVDAATDPKQGASLMHNHKDSLTHFMGIPDQRIQEFNWGFMFNYAMEKLFNVWETEWAAKQKRTIAHDDPSWQGVEKIIEFSDGMAWWNLHRSFCDREGMAMGHCGNSYRSNRPVEVLSLREPVDDGWKVNLTFIWNHETGMIEESKAFNNQKPDQKYHPYIIKLIQQPWVSGFDQEGSHEPENNFQMEDLDEETREELIAFNPGLSGAIHDDYIEKRYDIRETYPTETPPWLWAMDSEHTYMSESLDYHLMEAIDSPNGTYWKSKFLIIVDDDSHLVRYMGSRRHGESDPMDLVTKHKKKLQDILLGESLIEGMDFARMKMKSGLHEGDFPPEFLDNLYYKKPIMMGAIPDDRLDSEYDFMGSMYKDESAWFRNKEETSQDEWTLFVPFNAPSGEVFWKKQGQAFFFTQKSLAREEDFMVVYHFSDDAAPGWPWGRPITPPDEELYKYKDLLLHVKRENIRYGQYNKLGLHDFSEKDQEEIVTARPNMFELYR